MAAVAEAAAVQVGVELDEALLDLGATEMGQAEFLHARAVDERARLIQVVEPRVGGGVLARVEGGGDFAGGRPRLGQQGVHQGGLSHARLAHQHTGLAGEERAHCVGIAAGGQFHDLVAECAKDRQALARRFEPFRQVELVQHDEGAHVLTLCRDDAAGHQFVAEAGLRGDDDDGLGRVGGEQLLAEGVAAVEQGAAVADGGDDALVRPREFHRHPVAAGDVALLAAGVAERQRAAAELDLVLAAEGGDDQALGAPAQDFKPSVSISTLAAQMKSFMDRPPTEWVE